MVRGDDLLLHQLADRDHHPLVALLHNPHVVHQHHHLLEVYQLLLLFEPLQLHQRPVLELNLPHLSRFKQ